jgi:inner membrane protein COX18
MLAPILSQLPVFVLLTTMFNRLSVSPTPFDSEAFLTLTTLSHPDPTMFIPIAIGVVTMANVESASWMMSSAELALEKQAKEKEAQRIAQGGKPHLQVKSVLQSSMRILSIVRIVFASMFPGVSLHLSGLLILSLLM